MGCKFFARRRCTSYTDSQESVYLIAKKKKKKKKKFIKFTNKLYCWNLVKISSFVLLLPFTIIINFPVLPSGKFTMFSEMNPILVCAHNNKPKCQAVWKKKMVPKIQNLEFNKKKKKRKKKLKKKKKQLNTKFENQHYYRYST